MDATAVLWGFVVVSFREARAYIGTAVLRLIQYPVKLALMYYLWRAVLGSSAAALPRSLENIAGYYALALRHGIAVLPFDRVDHGASCSYGRDCRCAGFDSHHVLAGVR